MWLQFEQYAIPKAQAAAIHDRVDEDAVLAGLVRLWSWAQRERKTQVTATEIRGFFRVDCIEGLIAFDFLEPLEGGNLFRVRGTSRYILDHEARSRGGKMTGPKNLMRGRLAPGSLPAAFRLEPESSPAASRLGSGEKGEERSRSDLVAPASPSRSMSFDESLSPPPPGAQSAPTSSSRKADARVPRSARGGGGAKKNGATATETPTSDDDVHRAYAALKAAHPALRCWPQAPTVAFGAWYYARRAENLELGQLVIAATTYAADVLARKFDRLERPVLDGFLREEVWRQRLPVREEWRAACFYCQYEEGIVSDFGAGPSQLPVCADCAPRLPDCHGSMPVAEFEAWLAREKESDYEKQQDIWRLHERVARKREGLEEDGEVSEVPGKVVQI